MSNEVVSNNPSGSALHLVFYTNLILSIFAVIFWRVIVFRKIDMYGIKFQISYTKASSINPSWISQLKHLLFSTRSYAALGKAYGSETAVYLLFQKYLIMIIGVITLCSLLILLPVHVNGPEVPNLYYRASNDSRTETEISQDNMLKMVSISNVLRRPARLSLHILVAYLVTACVVVIMRHFVLHVRQVDEREPTKCVENYAVRINNLPKSLISPDPLLKLLRQLFPDEDLGSLYVAYNVGDRILMEQKLRRARRKLVAASAAVNTRGTWYTLCRWWKQCTPAQAEDHYKKRIEKLEKRIQEWESNVKSGKYQPKCAGFAHLVVRDTALVRRMVAVGNATLVHEPSSPRPGQDPLQQVPRIINIVHASHPQDTVWKNLRIDKPQKWRRKFIVWGIMILGLQFFTTPTSVVTWIRTFLGLSSATSTFIRDYVPSFLLLVITVGTPGLIEILTLLEGYTSRHYHKSQVMKRIYIYLLFAVFILPSLALTSIAELWALLHTGESDALQTVISTAGSRFFNFMIQVMTLASVGDLYRPYDLFIYFKYVVVTVFFTMDSVEKFSEQDEFEFAWQYPILLTVFIVVFTYSFFVPMIAVCGLFYFVIKFFIQRHHLRAFMYNNIDSMDSRALTDTVDQVLKLMFSNLVLGQLLLTIYMGLNRLALHATLFALLICASTASGVWLINLNKKAALSWVDRHSKTGLVQADMNEFESADTQTLSDLSVVFQTPFIGGLSGLPCSPVVVPLPYPTHV